MSYEMSEDELAAAQKSVANQNEPPPVVDPPVVDPPVVVADPPAVAVDSSLKTPVVDPPAAVTTDPPAPAISFEEQLEKFLEEKTAGKYKKFDDIKTVLDTPIEEIDPEIKHFQELKKNGVTLNKEFFELQNLDLEGDPEEGPDVEYIMLEAMKRKDETKGLSDRTLRQQLNKKYNYEGWIGKEDSELTDEDLANKEVMLRDARNDHAYLSKLKQDSTFVSPVNEELKKQQAEEHRQRISQFEKFVDDDLFAKVTSLTTEVQIDKDTKETFEYKPSEAVRSDAAKRMKLLPLGLSVLVDRFAEKDASGNVKINDRKVYEMLLKSETFDDAVANAYKDGIATGAKKFVKDDLKNISFKPTEQSTGNPVATTEAEALALAMKASGNKLT